MGEEKVEQPVSSFNVDINFGYVKSVFGILKAVQIVW